MANVNKLTEWAAAVKGRDGKCRHCGEVNDLHAHHIKPKSTHPELKLVVDNGMTLCYRCHKAEHAASPPVHGPRRPHRSTLQRVIDNQHATITALRTEIRGLNKRLGQCDRGSCPSGLALVRLVRNA